MDSGFVGTALEYVFEVGPSEHGEHVINLEQGCGYVGGGRKVLATVLFA